MERGRRARGSCCCAELHPRDPPPHPWVGGRDPPAGLTPLQLLPTTHFGSGRALEGKDRTRVRGGQVGAEPQPCGASSGPQTCGERTYRCPGNASVSPRARGASVTLQGHQRSSGQPPALHPATAQPLPQVDFIWKNSSQILIPAPLHPALTCFPLGPGLPGTPWGPGLPWEMWQDVTHGDNGPGGRKRAEPVTHLEAIVPLLAQVTLAALLALGESQGDLWWQREGQKSQDTSVGGEILSYGWGKTSGAKTPKPPFL